MDHHPLALLKLLDQADKAPGQVSQALSIPELVTSADDGYHFPSFPNAQAEEWYLEWWYFNFIDPATDLAGILMFEVLNPHNRFGLGRSGVSLILFRPEKSAVVIQDLYPITDFHASTDKAELRVGQANRLSSPDAETNDLTMRTQDGKVQLQLTFVRTAPGAFMSSAMTGPYQWENASWLCYSPQATVNGTITIEGKNLTLEDARGYHDHNWGKWLLPARTFVWAAFADPERGMHFNYGLSRGFHPGNRAILRVEGLDLIFPPDRIEPPQASDFQKFDGLFGIWDYPTHVSVAMIDSTGQYHLRMTWQILATAHLPKAPVVVFEHRARLQGRLSKLVDGNWEFFSHIEGDGFCEWTDTWIPLPGV